MQFLTSRYTVISLIAVLCSLPTTVCSEVYTDERRIVVAQGDSPLYARIVIKDDQLTALEIRKQQRAEPIQVLKVPEFEYAVLSRLNTEDNPDALLNWDMNFDGFNDIMLLSDAASAGAHYFLWLYAPDTKQFKSYDPETFLGFWNPVPDPKRKLVQESAINSVAYRNHQWNGDRLEEIGVECKESSPALSRAQVTKEGRTYFYEEPKPCPATGSCPWKRKGFLVTGDDVLVEGSDEQTRFVFVCYRSKNGTSSLGYLLAQDLNLENFGSESESR